MSGVGVDQLLVDVCGSLESGVEQPDESGDLEHIVEGNEVKDEAGELVSHRTRFIRLKEYNFFPVLKEKLGWGV